MREINLLKKILHESKYAVAFCSTGLMEECGRGSMRDQSRAYDIEKEYGYSPEEMFSAVFFSTRPEQFFHYYKKEVLPVGLKPNASFYCLKELEEQGVLKSIITNNIYNFFTKAGCKNVINLHGNVDENVCSGCDKKFTSDYILKSKGIPCCDVCGKIIRPQVRLFGEMVDNRKMTKAICEIEKSDVLLVIGCSMSSSFAERYVKYFDGKKIVLINPEEDYKDRIADLVIHRPITEVLSEIARYNGK